MVSLPFASRARCGSNGTLIASRVVPLPSFAPQFGHGFDAGIDCVCWRDCRAMRGGHPWMSPWALPLIALCVAAAGFAAQPVSASTPSKKRQPANRIPAEVTLINDQLHAHWEASKITPSPAGHRWRMVPPRVSRRAGPHSHGRRIEALHRRAVRTSAKSRLVDRLLGDEYVEEYARNWTTLWTNLLDRPQRRHRAPHAGQSRGPAAVAAPGVSERNMPYDRLVYELVVGHGVSKPGEEGFNGAVNFLAGNLQENAVQATAKTSQVFLGLQIQCTQCHNHPFNDWKQNQFWEMNAFFRQTRALRRFEKGARSPRRAGEPRLRRREQQARRGGVVLRAAQRRCRRSPIRCSSTARSSTATAALSATSIAATNWPS